MSIHCISDETRSNGNVTIGSLFDGSGGFPLAASLAGITPIWASEVEPYPIAVTRNRFPNMIHLGDVCKVNGKDIPPVDIVSFGSPCQDLSVAGSRSGIKHMGNGDEKTTRSGLFLEAIRIIREMREATNGRYPRYAVWENVTGAFSSNGGVIFGQSLKSLLKSTSRQPLCLRFQKRDGLIPTVFVETDGALRTEFLTLNTGESPSVAVESYLSQILEDDPPEKYYLSARACRGILQRSVRKGKELPNPLKEALIRQSIPS